MTERTWALLIICITIVFIVALITQCIIEVKKKKEEEQYIFYDPELWKHDIPCPSTKPPKKDAAVRGVLVGSKEWMEDE